MVKERGIELWFAPCYCLVTLGGGGPAMRRISAMLSFLFVAVATVVVAPAPAHARSATKDVRTTGFHWNDITARDGVVLKSNVIAPVAGGSHPGIVFVASWGFND